MKLDVYGRKNFVMETLMSNGIVVTTTDFEETSTFWRRYVPFTGDLVQDYHEHLAGVRELMDRRGLKPVYLTNPSLVCKRLYVRFRLEETKKYVARSLTVQLLIVLNVLFVVLLLIFTRQPSL